jgi:microcystin degradation protein MlrC
MQTLSPSAFTGIGVRLERMRVAVVKSTNHFRAAFDPVSIRTLYLAGPGALRADFRAFSYRNRTNEFWPRVALPAG